MKELLQYSPLSCSKLWKTNFITEKLLLIIHSESGSMTHLLSSVLLDLDIQESSITYAHLRQSICIAWVYYTTRLISPRIIKP